MPLPPPRPHPAHPRAEHYAHIVGEAAAIGRSLAAARRDACAEVVAVLEHRHADLLGRLDRMHGQVVKCLTSD